MISGKCPVIGEVCRYREAVSLISSGTAVSPDIGAQLDYQILADQVKVEILGVAETWCSKKDKVCGVAVHASALAITNSASEIALTRLRNDPEARRINPQ